MSVGRGTSLRFPSQEVLVIANLFLDAATVPAVWAIGIVLIVIGVLYLLRERMLLGAVLLIVGILMGGLNIFGAFD